MAQPGSKSMVTLGNGISIPTLEQLSQPQDELYENPSPEQSRLDEHVSDSVERTDEPSRPVLADIPDC